MRTLPPLATRDRVIDAVLVVSCGVVQAALLGVAAFATRDVFAALHTGGAADGAALMRLVFAALSAAACQLLSRRQSEALGQSYAAALRHTLYEQIATLPRSRHDARRLGALSLRFVGDLSAARLWFGQGLPHLLAAVVVLPGAAAVLAALHPRLAAFAVLPVLAALALCGLLAWQLGARHRNLRGKRAGLAIRIIERIAVSPELDLMGRTPKELRALDEDSKALRTNAIARIGRTAALQAVLQSGLALGGAVILWQAGRVGASPGTAAAMLSVLALLVMPLHELAAAWDKFCAWQVARGKAQALLGEPALSRRRAAGKVAPDVRIMGQINGIDVDMRVAPCESLLVQAPAGNALARVFAGLDRSDDYRIAFNDSTDQPQTALIGDTHVGLQGSLRRSAGLMARKRPNDAKISAVLTRYGLGGLAQRDRGLDTRIAEAGRNLTRGETLRLDLVRAVLGKAQLVIISSDRWAAEPEQDLLLGLLQDDLTATIIIVETLNDTVAGRSAAPPDKQVET